MGRPAKMYRTDRGGEFVNRGMDRWASEEGLVHQTTAPYTPQQNGKAERFNRSLMEKVTAVMTAAKCDNALWAEAAATVVYAMNRTARAGQLLTPHELWSGQRPSVAHMRTFGCAAYVLTPAKFRRKLDPRGRKGIFVGYEPDTKAYRVWVSGKIVISRDVVFDESFMGDNVEEPPVEAEYDWAAVNDNDSDEDGAPSGNLAPKSAAGVADVTDQALPADEDSATDADSADGAVVTADVDGTASEAAELEMSTLLNAARRASGLPTPPNLLEMGTAVPDDSPGADGETIVSVDASLMHARYPGRARTAPVRLGEGDAHSSLCGATDDERINAGAALAVRVGEPAAGINDVMAADFEEPLGTTALVGDAAPDLDAVLHRNSGTDACPEHGSGNGAT